jgi:hypothetical protein
MVEKAVFNTFTMIIILYSQMGCMSHNMQMWIAEWKTVISLHHNIIKSYIHLQNKISLSGIEPRIVCQGCDFCFCNLHSETNNFALVAFLLTCLDSKLQKSPAVGLKLRILFQSFCISKISSCSQGVSMPHLMQVCLSILELQENIHIENIKCIYIWVHWQFFNSWSKVE